MCSIGRRPARPARPAIDELAEQTRSGAQPAGGEPGTDDVAQRLAGIWAMVADLDPGLAQRLPRLRGPGRMNAEAPLNRRQLTAAAGPLNGDQPPRSGADDLDVQRGADLRVQPDRNLVRPEGLDRVAHLDAAPVEFGAARGADRGRDVRRAHRAEQPPGSACLGLQPHA